MCESTTADKLMLKLWCTERKVVESGCKRAKRHAQRDLKWEPQSGRLTQIECCRLADCAGALEQRKTIHRNFQPAFDVRPLKERSKSGARGSERRCEVAKRTGKCCLLLLLSFGRCGFELYGRSLCLLRSSDS